MFVVDSNVLVYSVNAEAPENARCRALLEGWRAGPEPWGTTWSVLYEFVRVATHLRVFKVPLRAEQAWTVVDAICASPGFRVLVETDRHAELARRTLSEVPLLSGNVFHDVHTAVVMREHGVRRIWTRDTDFHRFPFLEAVDPMAPAS